MNQVLLAVLAANLCNIVLAAFPGLSLFPNLGGDRKKGWTLTLQFLVMNLLASLTSGLIGGRSVVLTAVLYVATVLVLAVLVSLVRKGWDRTQAGLIVISSVLGTVLIYLRGWESVGTRVLDGFLAVLVYLLAAVMLSAIREDMEYHQIPKGLRGPLILLVTAGLMTIAFHGTQVLW